jgi:hypothetical protein
MQHTKLVACASAAVLAFAIACSKDSPSPVSPSGAQPGITEAAPDGSTLKVSAPTPVSPVNNEQPEGSLVLIASKAQGKFADVTPSYEFEIYRGTTRVYTSGVTGGAGSGPNNVAHSANAALEFDQQHTWRVRAVFQGAAGPWSSSATFRAPAGGYIRDNEIFDPLTTGRTVGNAIGTEFIPGQGLRLIGHTSRVTYELPTNLQQGEFSLMATGYDEGSPGDKTKIMSMQEGFGDLTTNDYRMTVEKRGRSYITPGAVTWRIIMGEADDHDRIIDGFRTGVGFSDERWYFWRFTWGTGTAALEVREDGPRGRVIYFSSNGERGFRYRPVPHIVHLGASVGRAGPGDASIPGAIYKNVWLSSRPRPAFPGE